MADAASKAQKLASARKKFKELKKEKKKTSETKTNEGEISNNSREQIPIAVTSVPDTMVPVTTPLMEESLKEVQPNCFDCYDNDTMQKQQPVAFFDDLIINNGHTATNIVIDPSPINYFNNMNTNTVDSNDFFNRPHISQEENSTPSLLISSEPPNSIISEQFSEVFQEPTSSHDISSVESLEQLSREMAQLICPADDYQLHMSQESSLEVRNQELAGLLSQEKVKCEQLSANIAEMQLRIAQLESEVRDKESGSLLRSQQEISNLREELQCHVQTVGILVGEKAELSANLSQFQLVAKQKSVECEELQNRLKASRSRVGDLEREINILKGEKSQFDNVGRDHVTELDKLKKDYIKLKDEKEELNQELLEAREKLKSSSEANLNLQQQISELSGQLSMANIKIQQISTGNQPDSGLVETLTQEKFNLEKQIVELDQTIKTLAKDREESSVQYQNYAQNLNNQLANLAMRLEQAQIEKENLAQQEQNRIKHIGELEKQLQSLQNDHMSFTTQRSNGEVKAEIDSLHDLIERLQAENAEMTGEKARISKEKDSIAKELESKSIEVEKLESLVDELKSNQPDNAKLLATMESDKVAASRAVLQNTELKRELESMQEVFIKLNNDKVELTDKLTSENKDYKDLMEKLQKTELHLQTLADAIEIKDRELHHLRENSMELKKNIIQSEQLSDRLRHYEAQDHSSHSLQHELQEAKIRIAELSEELANSANADKVDSCNNCEEVGDLKRKFYELQSKVVISDSTDDHLNILDKESAMKHLEEKFLKTMDEIADLTEEKQRLEHLVQQLQGETETIGEYVALYQHQRSILKQKAIEKDQQLTQLANDRELIKDKLEKLNNLVKKLVVEKGTITSELLQHHENLSKESGDLCEEHARIHSEINKITENHRLTKQIGDNNSDNDSSTETAEEIIALLSEIKTSNLVQPTANYHHCPWCSGQLITV